MTTDIAAPGPIRDTHLRRLIKRGLTLVSPAPVVQGADQPDSVRHICEFLLAEPYSTMTRYFLEQKFTEIIPDDSESALFIPRIPVEVRSGEKSLIETAGRAGAVIPADGRILAACRNGAENPFLFFSIACFSIFVKFFVHLLEKKKRGDISVRDLDYIREVRSFEYRYTPRAVNRTAVTRGDDIREIVHAGKSAVSLGLVDAIFGNISLRNGEKILISESGAGLDDLEGRVVAVPLSGKIGSGAKPSSELEVHRNIYKKNDHRRIIHGHPLFTVILSIGRGSGSMIGETPVIPDRNGDGGEILENSVPEVIGNCGLVIVRGHGLFCSGNNGFPTLLQKMTDMENYCREECFRELR